jgi:predicted metal-dependent hydrolase
MDRTDQPTIVTRRNLEFQFDADVPRYWLGNDAFRTRFFDACSLRFPAGERFFVQCVRDYAGAVRDPSLAQMVKEFIAQEGQHSMQHSRFNQRLEAQGMPVELIDRRSRGALDFFRRVMPKKFTLALTAAGEHMTSITSHGLFERGHQVFAEADERVVALFAWHGAEEIEHKAVAHRVYREAADGGYLLRAGTMLYITLQFFLHTFFVMTKMFNADGIAWHQQLAMWPRGLRWLFGRNGLYRPALRHYLAYFRLDFDPWQAGGMAQYQCWRSTFDATGDAVLACRAVVWPQRSTSLRAEFVAA